MQELGLYNHQLGNTKKPSTKRLGMALRSLKAPLEQENHQQETLPTLKYCKPIEMKKQFYIRALENSRISNTFHLKQKVLSKIPNLVSKAQINRMSWSACLLHHLILSKSPIITLNGVTTIQTWQCSPLEVVNWALWGQFYMHRFQIILQLTS